MRNPEYVQYGATVISNQRDLDRGEAKFNEMSVEERSKFKEETLVNVSGRSRRQRYSKSVPLPFKCTGNSCSAGCSFIRNRNFHLSPQTLVAKNFMEK